MKEKDRKYQEIKRQKVLGNESVNERERQKVLGNEIS